MLSIKYLHEISLERINMKILVTGCSGFIGMHVALKLLEQGHAVIGIDNHNDYYDPQLKLARLKQLNTYSSFKFVNGDIADQQSILALFAKEQPQRVINLAGQPGVRHSIKNPHVYIQSNIVGFCNILEGCRHYGVEHLIYASSSSVYGANTCLPFSVNDNVDHPLSLYAASKKANELMAHTYSHLYNLPTTGLRYFTVYGPWGRPDMSPWLFTSAILDNRPIDVFNYGKMQRAFSFIEDIVDATLQVFDLIPQPNIAFGSYNSNLHSNHVPYKLYNIGGEEPVELITFIRTLESLLGKTAKINFLPMQPGDMIATHADLTELKNDIDFQAKTTLEEGLKQWVEWWFSYKK